MARRMGFQKRNRKEVCRMPNMPNMPHLHVQAICILAQLALSCHQDWSPPIVSRISCAREIEDSRINGLFVWVRGCINLQYLAAAISCAGMSS